MSSDRVKAFGREVRRRRLAADMTLATLAEASGLTPIYLGEVEAPKRRKRGLSLEVAFRIADGLGVDLPELLGVRGLSGAGLEAGRLVSTFKPTMRMAVIALLRGIARRERG
jgi:transcriptional regulator with XRE-family HTH domain